MKKSTMPLLLILGTIVILYFGWPGIRKLWKEDGLKSNTSQSNLKPEPQQAQPVDADLPLNSKDTAVACGKTLKLKEATFTKLALFTRFSQLMDDSGFTDEERKEPELEKGAFESYSLAYLTWEKPTQVSRASLGKMVIHADSSVDKSKLSSAERVQWDAYMAKYRRLMLKAFELGRHDAKISPCPY